MSASVWKRNSLGKIGNFSNGVNKPKEAFGHGTKFVNISDVFLPSLKIRDLDKVEISDNEKSFYGLKKDDLLFVRSSVKPDGVGYNTIFEDSNEDIVFCGFVIRFRKSSYEIDAHFLNFLLRSPEYRKQIISFSTVSANTNINQVSLKRIEIEYPQDIKEQKHISDILSTCDTVIQRTQKTIDKYRAIKQGMMQDLFTRGLTKDGKLRPLYKEAPELYKESELGMIPKEWSETPVIEIGEVISGGTPSTKNTDFWDGNIPFVTPNDLSVNEGAYITSTERYITVLGLSKSSAIELPKGTLIISSRAPIGYLAIASFNCVTNQGCKSVVFDSKQAPLFHYYNFQRYVNKMKSLGSGTTFAEISKKDVEKLKVSYPLKEEQNAIAKRLSSIDSTIQKEESVLEKYKNIKNGLMARLLTPPEDTEIIDETGE